MRDDADSTMMEVAEDIFGEVMFGGEGYRREDWPPAASYEYEFIIDNIMSDAVECMRETAESWKDTFMAYMAEGRSECGSSS